MNRPGRAPAADAPHVVLVNQGCRYAWEPTADPTGEHLHALRDGCPNCGDWLFLGELTNRVAARRRAHR